LSVSEAPEKTPKVGAVIVFNDKILGSAYRGELAYGDHAEYTLIKKKLKNNIPSGSVLYTTFEPCTSRSPGKTSCAEHIIESGIKHVVIGTLDPNPQIHGRGQERLRQAGIRIDYFDSSRSAIIDSINYLFYKRFGQVSKAELQQFVPSQPYLFIFCGASSVGKDTLLSRIRGRMISLGIKAEFVKKYTTRNERPGETYVLNELWHDPSSKYVFLSEEEFHSTTDIIGNYEKYDEFYGFSSSHLKSPKKSDRVLSAIYGDIEEVQTLVNTVEHSFGRKCRVYLLRAELSELASRLERRRGFSKEIGMLRMEEMKIDVVRIERLIRHRGDFQYYTNGNDDNPDRIAELILREMLIHMEILKSPI
jgi:pyrimidine deaminase RibD-like protein/guanylate kinase